jgi:SPP1 family predicted phage head-tail adaptor
MIGAGKMDRRLTIQRAQSVLDDFGGQTVTWVTMGVVWAAKKDVSDAERFRAGEIAATITTRFQIRWTPELADLNPRDRVVCEERIYEVYGVKEIGRREGFELSCAARAE